MANPSGVEIKSFTRVAEEGATAGEPCVSSDISVTPNPASKVPTKEPKVTAVPTHNPPPKRLFHKSRSNAKRKGGRRGK